MIFESEAGGGAGGGESELVDNLFPEFVVGDGLPPSFFADGPVEFIEVEFLSSDLWYFYVGDALGGPVLVEVFFEFILFFQLGEIGRAHV